MNQEPGTRNQEPRPITAVIEREENGFVARCPALDVASQGETAAEARRNLSEAVVLFLQAAEPSEIDERLGGELDDGMSFNLNVSPEGFSEQARFLLAARLYELRRVTSGQAAAICGMGRVELLLSLHRVGVPAINLRPEDVEEELSSGRSG